MIFLIHWVFNLMTHILQVFIYALLLLKKNILFDSKTFICYVHKASWAEVPSIIKEPCDTDVISVFMWPGDP